MSALYIILLIGVVSVSLLLLLLVLMQRPRQEGLGATFGVDVTSQMFGSRTTDVLQKGTVYLTVIFFLLCIGIGLLNARESKQAAQLRKQLAEQTPPEPVKPPEPPPAVPTTTPALEGRITDNAGGLAVPPAVPGADERSAKQKELTNKLQELQKLIDDPATSEEVRAQKRKELEDVAAEAEKLESEPVPAPPAETPPAAPAPVETPPAAPPDAPAPAPEPPKSPQ